MIKRRNLAELIQTGGDSALRNGVEVSNNSTQQVSQQTWATHLATALAEMPEELAAKIIHCLPREVLIEALRSRSDDPMVRLALLLLAR
ncbi:MAG: hypothetical protein ACPL3C_05875 [Pyrobaculum sp.]